MYLERLELIGFKSFAQKTALEFPGGITAIVGPNGSGKSNVIDAIRWLLGEREAKNVRGSRTEDLIFSGTPKRARAGMAEVRLVFDNAHKVFPLEFAEVAVRRRVTRDGTTQYFVNDAEMRLKDVIDLFAQARLGTKGFTIVNQGDSDLFVRSVPRDRRVMLEEILGVRQYELKRHEAEHKLAATRVNMDKVKALIEEITPHLRLLRRQTARWEKHAEYEKELRTLEDEFYRAQYAALRREAEALEPDAKELESALSAKTGERRKLEEKLRVVEEEAPKGSGDLEAARKKQEELFVRRAGIEKELGKLEVRVELFAARGSGAPDQAILIKTVREARKAVAEILKETDTAKARASLEVLLRELDRALGAGEHEREGEGRALAEANEKLGAELAELERELKERGTLEKKLAAGLSEFNIEFKKAYAALEAKKDEIAALERQMQKFVLGRERIVLKREEIDHQVRAAMRKPEEFRDAHAAPKESAELAVIERRMLRLRGELASIGEIDPALMKEAEETAKRHEFLSTQLDDLEKAAKDLAALIKDLGARIHGKFAESLHAINAEFSTYVHAMFGGGKARLVVVKPERMVPEANGAEGETAAAPEPAEAERENEFAETGIEIEISIPRKKISSLEMLSGGERSLVSLAVLFALISVSPPPFLVLDEVDAALDEQNSRRFAELVKQFEKKTQFIVVTHNRATMESANVLYGVTMNDDGTSRVLSLKLEEAEKTAEPAGAAHGG